MRNMRSGVIFAIHGSEPDQSTANRSPAGSKAAPPCLTDAVNCAPKTGDPVSTSGPHPTVPGYNDSNRRSRLGRKNCTNNGENATGRQCTNCVHLQSAIARRQRFRLHNTLQKLFQLPTPTRYKVGGGAKYCLGRNVLHSVLGTLADQLRCINIKLKRQASAGSEMRWILPFDAI
jgi:hypothetical protein